MFKPELCRLLESVGDHLFWETHGLKVSDIAPNYVAEMIRLATDTTETPLAPDLKAHFLAMAKYVTGASAHCDSPDHEG